jgi:hypothetical protein
MIPLDLANPLVGMAGITAGTGRYIAGRHAACSPGSRHAACSPGSRHGLDGRAVIPATGRPSPTSVLFAMPADGPPFAAGPRGFHGRELKAAHV